VHENFRHFRGTTELEWMAWLRKILVNHLTDFQKGLRRERRSVTREGSLESLVDRSSAMLRNLGPAPERTGRSPDAARMLWARAMQRVGGLLKGRLS
jgi:DNA-directed RNA polymerase specialized sigma24 family protein